MSVQFWLLVSASVALLASLAHADILPDTARLVNVVPGRSRIVVKKPYTFSIHEGVSMNASWFADCTGSVPGTDMKYGGSIKLVADDYLTIDKVTASRGDIAYELTVHAKNATAQTPRKFTLSCAHNYYGLPIKTSDPQVSTVADLRRALDWSVWIEGEVGDGSAAVAADANGAKTVTHTYTETHTETLTRVPASGTKRTAE